MKVYTRNDIINMASSTNGQNERTQQNHLENMIKYLTENPRAVKVLEWGDNKNNFFLNQEMNLTATSSNKPYEGYSYNLKTAIFLAILLDTYDFPFIQFLINNKYCNEGEGEIWIDYVEKLICNYEKRWQGEGDGREWEIIALNIVSILYELTMPEINEELIAGLNDKVTNMCNLFLTLPDDKKYIAYKKIENRLNWITNYLEGIAQNLTPSDKLLNKVD